jgi:probable addiction module antidote protein
MKPSKSYRDGLIQSLQDPEEAAAYLNAALEEENLEVFLLALRNVVDATGGVSQLAADTDKSRESLYKTLSKQGNPYLASIQDILDSMGYRLSVTKKDC